MSRTVSFVIECAALQTARGRLVVFTVLSLLIFLVPYHWLDHLSVWGHLGLSKMPSIGLTRAYWRFLHGNPVGAWHRNPLIYVVLIVGVPLLARDALTLARKR